MYCSASGRSRTVPFTRDSRKRSTLLRRTTFCTTPRDKTLLASTSSVCPSLSLSFLYTDLMKREFCSVSLTMGSWQKTHRL
ncbi:hypothetical protein E2C01_007522 [Portunus trituberculatus]|uniref:Uncharacterized protein n=1 Tax=Portunus trituberculatus TaxID=210409 RepID=A0A5B7CZ90_PORTR|nr:hypothetical protein [Portunus trituberculatus]